MFSHFQETKTGSIIISGLAVLQTMQYDTSSNLNAITLKVIWLNVYFWINGAQCLLVTLHFWTESNLKFNFSGMVGTYKILATVTFFFF